MVEKEGNAVFFKIVLFALKCVSLHLGFFQLVHGELTEFIDLGHGFDDKTVYWMDGDTFTGNISERSEPFFYAMGELTMPEHGGTHIDAPYHFSKDGLKLGQIPLSHLILPGVLVDVSKKVGENRSYLLTSEDLADWEKEHGELNANSKYIMLVKFGWSHKYVNRSDYLGIGLDSSNPKGRSFPGIGESGVKWIATKGNIVGVGVDVASVDSGASSSLVTHKTLAKKNIYGLENVDLSSKKVPSKGFYLIIMPIKHADGSGGPVRIIASPESLNRHV